MLGGFIKENAILFEKKGKLREMIISLKLQTKGKNPFHQKYVSAEVLSAFRPSVAGWYEPAVQNRSNLEQELEEFQEFQFKILEIVEIFEMFEILECLEFKKISKFLKYLN